MKKPIIENLFPIPIYMSNIDRKFTKQELQFVDESKKQIVVKMKEILILKIIIY
jgi:hypothetical protein